jgi:hypothetical protein
MVPMSKVDRRDHADRINGSIPPEAIEFPAFPEELIVSGILKLLINKSFHQWAPAG